MKFCPFCGNNETSKFSHFSLSTGLRVEVKKVQCTLCGAEAEEHMWDKRHGEEAMIVFIRRAHELTCEWTLSEDGGDPGEGLDWINEVEAVEGLIKTKIADYPHPTDHAFHPDVTDVGMCGECGWVGDPSKIEQSKDHVTDVSKMVQNNAQLPEPNWNLKVTLSGAPAAEGSEHTGAPQPIDPGTGMHKDYWVLPEEERKKGFIRPYRDRYKHAKCGTVTTMGRILSETYARDPKFYGATFCCGCFTHFPVAEFTWMLDGEVVGS